MLYNTRRVFIFKTVVNRCLFGQPHRFEKYQVKHGSFLAMIGLSSIANTYNDDEIIKSAADKRQYRALELTNGMKIMLISDPDTDKSSAALDVHIGHLKDPRDIPGLAHFCEHMLFLGTKKYPEENEYNKYLSEHGGASNAFTSLEHTNYYFDITPEHLAGALDRFAQFFTHPLFTAAATGREVNAVDSENSRNLQIDSWRLFQLDKSLANPEHDFSKFGTGNKETLETATKARGVDVRDELLKFHSKYYSSNIMGLCVLSKESLDDLQDMVVPLFENVVNKNVEIPRWEEAPYTEKEMMKQVHAVPVKDLREMCVIWNSPDLSEFYKANAAHYLGHLIGHEGAGSLLSELKSRGWANTLVGGQRSGGKGFSFFTVAVDLSDKGQENTDEIVKLIYQYINMLRQEGHKEWVFKECQQVAALSFNFKDKEQPRSYTTAIAGRLNSFPIKDVLSAYSLFDDFRPDLIDKILEQLTPENMRVSVISKKFESEADQTERWYGTKYSVKEFTSKQRKVWNECGNHPNLYLPSQNDFIPTNFDLVTKDEEASPFPEVIKNTPFCRLWHKQDDKFLKPKACLNLDIISPIAYMDPLHANFNALFTQLFEDAINEYSYMAEIAGLHYNLENTVYGISLSVKGYNDKLGIILNKILEKMTTFKVDPVRLAIFKEIHSRNLKNFQAEQPHQHSAFYTALLTSEVLWTKDELVAALDDVNAENLQAFVSRLLSKVFIEGLAYGNISKSQAESMMEIVENTLEANCNTKAILPSQNRRLREFALPDGCSFQHKQTNHVHESTCTEIYYQTGPQNTQSNMLLELFCQIISEPCFNILRTKEQLGYIVFSGVRRSKAVQGVRVLVQSPKPPRYVEGRIEAFLMQMDGVLKNITQEEFDKHVNALASRRLEQPKKLMQQNKKYWTEIISSYYHFDRDNVEVESLRKLSKEDLYQFYCENIRLDAPKRHKLSVHISSERTADSSETDAGAAPTGEGTDGLLPTPGLPQPDVVTDVMEFKRDLSLFPQAKPVIDVLRAKAKL